MASVFCFLKYTFSALMEDNSEDGLKNPITSHEKPTLPSGLTLLISFQSFKQTLIKC